MNWASTIETTEKPAPSAKARFGIFYLLLVIVVATLLVRSFYLQIMQGNTFLARAEGNRVAVLPLDAARGLLYDEAGNQLVENVASTDIVLDPGGLPRDDEAPLLERLPTLLDLPVQDVRDAITIARTRQRVVTLARAVPHEYVLRVEEALKELPGVRIVSSSVRKYLYPDATAHLLGYTGTVTTEDLNHSPTILPTEQIGKSGIEKQYDTQLRGTPGESYTEINASGRSLTALGQKDALPGHDLTLSINVKLQEYIHDLLTQRVEKNPDADKGASVVALDPRTGAIRALVSYPTFDPNVFSEPGERQNAQNIVRDSRQPLFNRVTDGMYPPGSTIKPLLAAAALQEKVITPSTTVLSTGGLAVGPWRFPDWKAGGHGITDVHKALAESVNTFFYIITGGDPEHTGLGVERATAYLRQFGWGKPTGIDEPSEAAGFLPSPTWKQKVKKESWYIGDTYHLGIGQGDVLVTPLQVANATATIANGGTLHTPYVVTPNKEVSHVKIDAANLAEVRQGMRQAVTDGSARILSKLPIPLGAKTGTAQVGGAGEDTHAWLTSFGPYDAPQLVVTVLLERGGEGNADAAPLARDIWQWWSEHVNKSP